MTTSNIKQASQAVPFKTLNYGTLFCFNGNPAVYVKTPPSNSPYYDESPREMLALTGANVGRDFTVGSETMVLPIKDAVISGTI